MSKYTTMDLERNLDILDFIPDWVKITGIDGTILFANRALCRELKFNPRGMDSESLAVVHESDIFLRRYELSNWQQEGPATRNIFHDGNFYNVAVAPIRSASGEVSAVVEVYRDVTQQRQTEYQLTLQNEDLQRDIQFTKKIQRSILPKQLHFSKLSFEYLYRPCESLSGDIFDVIPISEHTTGAYICDVAGHGVAAAMVTVFVRETMRNLEDFRSSAFDLKALHRRFLELRLDVEQYLTMFHVMIDTHDRTVSYANAGHNCPMFLVRNRDVQVLTIQGRPVSSLYDSVDYKECIAPFEPGDAILLMTDGIIEAKNVHGEEFGVERVVSEIRKKPDHILDGLKKALTMFAGDKRADDMCALLIHYRQEDEHEIG